MCESELIRLQKIWYKKLKESGFEDQEEFNSDMEPYREFTGLKNNIFKLYNKGDTQDQIEEYFSRARRHLHKGDFPSELEKTIWRLHSEGHTQSEITKVCGAKRYLIRKVLKEHKTIILRIRKE